jgi:4-carboxymuconolactone decarboxylase
MSDDTTPTGAAPTDPVAAERAARRARGLERMGEVYSFEVSDGLGDFFGYTVEHLFGDIWEREGLSLRDRRLLLIGLMVAEGLDGTLGIQLESALAKGDLSAEDLREIVIFLTHYAGWPKGAGFNSMVETAIARHQKSRSGE